MNKNIELLCKNVKYLAKQSKKGIGGVEKELAISKGYISRCSTEYHNTRMSLELALRIADYFNRPLFELITRDLTKGDATVSYVSDIISKLCSVDEWCKDGSTYTYKYGEYEFCYDGNLYFDGIMLASNNEEYYAVMLQLLGTKIESSVHISPNAKAILDKFLNKL